MPTITVDIKAIGGAQIQREFERASAAVGRTFPQSAKVAESQIRSMNAALETQAAIWARVKSQAIGAFAAGLGIGAIASFTKSIVDSTNKLIGWQNALKAVSPSAEIAAQSLAFVRAEADRLGLNLESMAGQYARFSAATRGTSLEGEKTREIFTSMSEAARVLNLSVESTEGAFRALEQMVSKGTVQAEELRGQLGERLPGAFRIAAEAMGVTTAELDKMLKDGEITAEDLLPKLAARLKELYAAGAVDAANSPSAEINRLSNSLFDLRIAIGESGFMESITSGARGLTDSIRGIVESGAIDAVASGLTTIGTAAAFAFGGRALGGIGAFVARTIESAAETAKAAKAAESAAFAKNRLAQANATAAGNERLYADQVMRASIGTEYAEKAANDLSRARIAQIEANHALIMSERELAAARTQSSTALASFNKIAKGAFNLIGGWPTVILAAAYALYKMGDAIAYGDSEMQDMVSTMDALTDRMNKNTESALKMRQGVSSAFVESSNAIEEMTAKVAKSRAEISGILPTFDSWLSKILLIGGPQSSKLFENQVNSANIEEATETLNRQYEAMARSLAVSDDMTKAYEDQAKAVFVGGGSVEDYNAAVLASIPTMARGVVTAKDIGSAYQESSKIIEKAGGSADSLRLAIAELASKGEVDVQRFARAWLNMLGIMHSGNAEGAVADAGNQLSESGQKFIDSMNTQRETLGKNQQELIIYNAEIQAAKEKNEVAAEAIREAARMTAFAIDAYERETEANRKATKAKKEKTEAEKLHEEQLKQSKSALDDLIGMNQHFSEDIENLKARLAGATDIQIQYNNAVRDADAAYQVAIQSGETATQAAEQHAAALANAAEAMQLMADLALQEQGQELNNALEDSSATLGMTERQMVGYRAGIEAARKAQKTLNAELLKTPGLLDRIQKEASDKATKVFDMSRIQEILDQFSQKSPMQSLRDDLELIEEAIAGSKAGLEEFAKVDLSELEKAAKATRLEIGQQFLSTTNEALRGIQSMTEEGSRAYAQMQVAIDAVTVAEAILAVIHQASSGDVYTAIPRMIAMIAAIASLGVSVGNLSGGGGSESAASRQATQGTGTVLGDSEAKSESIANAVEITADATSALVGINRGMLRALENLQRALGAAGGQLARGAADVDFGALAGDMEAPIGSAIGNAIIGWVHGGSESIIDQGVIIAGATLQEMLNGIVVGAYATIETDGGLFGSDSTNDRLSAVSDEFTNQFQLVINSLADAVSEGAEALGLLPADIEAALAAYRVEEIRISLMDLSAEEQQAELEAVFSSIFDGLAGSVVPFIAQFQQVGEGLGETLVRVATEVQVFQEAIGQLGLVVDETDPERFAQIADGLIQTVGGIEDFIEQMNTFVSNFTSDAHAFEIATEAINSAFEQYGLAVPPTRDAMFDLMQTLDATTEEGREQIATLLRLSSVAAEYYDALEEFQKLPGELMQELGQSGGFAEARQAIEDWERDTIAGLNALARARGREAASEQDLVNAHAVAAQRVAQLIARLKEEAADLAVQLGYITGTDTLESLNAQIESMSNASVDAADAIGQAVDSMREKMNLLLGDLSPFNDQKKLELALQGLREGTVDPEQVLEIGRRLYASTSQYTDLFNMVMGMAQFGGGGITPGSDTSADGRTLQELIAARDALLAAQRPDLADDLAHRIAELAAATGETFAEIAEGMGFDIANIADDLNLSGDQLNELLNQYMAQFEAMDFGSLSESLTTNYTENTDRIVAAIEGKAVADAVAQADAEAADRDATNTAQQSTEYRLTAIETAINSQTSALISAGIANTDREIGSQQDFNRELREYNLRYFAESDRRTPVMIR